MKLLYLFFLLSITSIHGFCQGPGLPFSKYYSSQEYQGGIQNFAITQNEPGLLYVANNFGLLEYDGTSWRRFSLRNSTKIRDVLVDDNGVVFVSGQAEFGYFIPDQRGNLQFNSLVDQLPDSLRNLEEVWKIHSLHDHIIFCTTDVLFLFSKDLKFEKAIHARENILESFHFHNNQLFVNQNTKGLQILENGNLLALENGAFFGNERITGILSLANHQKLVFTRDNGAYMHTPSGNSPWQSAISSLQLQINKVIRLRNGDIVIGTQRDGLFIVSDTGKIRIHMDKDNGLENNTVLSLFEDVSGNLWIGHNNGITLLELSLPFRRMDESTGLSGTGYNAHYFDGKLYYGTNNGASFQRISPEIETYPVEIQGTAGQVYQITDIQDMLLIAHNDGAMQVKGTQVQHIKEYGGVWNFHPLKEYPDLILSGTYNGLVLYEIVGKELKFLRKIRGFEESCRILQQDTDGNIWMTHGYKGVYRLQLNSSLDTVVAKYYGTDEGLPSKLLISVWQINNRLLFTTEYGVYSYNPAKDRFERDRFFSKYFKEDLLITSMVEDPLGNIFYIGENEVGVLEKQINGTYVKNNPIFNKILPYLNDDLQNISLIGANEVLFAAKDGFIWYKLENTNQSTLSYPTLIRSIYLTGNTDSVLAKGRHHPLGMDSGDQISIIPYPMGNIRFEYSNPIPNNENTTQFQFWLEGMEEGYGEWSTKRDKEYTNLKEGKYVFHVKSKNIYGQIGREDTFEFEVLPPWYRSTWAFLIYTCIGLASIYFTYLLIEKRYRKKAARITNAQRKALHVKETALRSSHEEIERLKYEKLQVEIKGKNKELASATMHLINKNGFIDHVKTHLSSIIKKSKNNEVKNELQKVVVSIDRNIADDREWEQFEIHFDQVHGDFINRFKKFHQNLSPQEIKLSAYLRMNLSSKEIASLMNISTRGVEIARYRLRKKLSLERADNLQEYILKF